MDHSVTRVRVEDIEEVLGQIADIKAARVVTSDDGAITEIHVLALPSKSPKQLVRDIESAIMARFGLSVDHRKISIAQLGSEFAIEEPAPRVLSDVNRPRIVGVNSSVAGLRSSATVTLMVDGLEYVGAAAGVASQSGRLRQVASATLDAVGQCAPEDATFSLEDVSVIHLGRQRVAVSCVTLVTLQGEEAFSGSAVIRQNESDSVVRATLDAVNRRIGLLTIE
jgi:hypothetical protein